MKATQLADVITDAVADAVREMLPRLIGEQIEARLAVAVVPALDTVRRDVERLGPHLLDASALDETRRDFEQRLATFGAGLTREHVETRAGITKAVEGALAARLAPELESVHKACQTVHERLTDMQADFAQRGIAQSDALTNSWQRQVEALQASIAEKVHAAADGIALKAGPSGAQGTPGRDGRDATFTPPVHYKAGSIYVRGTLVQHRGGVWFANVDTDAEPGEPCSGYGLVLDGCEPLRVDAWGDAGELALVYRYASGVVKAIPLGFRPMQHVGIYDHARAYLANDCVTCDGSVWLARAATHEVKPGTDDGARAWQLIVKRGKDGRDGNQGAPGPRGEPGPAGAAAPVPRARAKVNGGAA